jgi:hypothetical protein
MGYDPTGFNYAKNEFGRVSEVGAEKVGASSVYFTKKIKNCAKNQKNRDYFV